MSHMIVVAGPGGFIHSPKPGWIWDSLEAAELIRVVDKATPASGRFGDMHNVGHVIFREGSAPWGYRSVADWIARNARTYRGPVEFTKDRLGQVIVKPVELGQGLYRMTYFALGLAVFLGIGALALYNRSSEANAVA
ncbi:MAG: hypothetical protein HY539_00550 [Deltaproteobacteria bacterium]|nr:hypothetical protein [Deltaproteobacteria bacterium]